MSKSVYSLVLSDDIIRAVDAAAYKLNTSRSGLIDRILAEHLSVQTPQVRMLKLMESIGRFFDDDVFVLDNSAMSSGVVVRTPLPYKYNPTIRYSVEFSRDYETLGRLKINFRTRNAALLMTMAEFIEVFSEVEAKYLSRLFPIHYETDGDKLIRRLNAPVRTDGRETISTDELAKAVADYVSFFDRMIKLYFENCERPKLAAELISKAYHDRMMTGVIFF